MSEGRIGVSTYFVVFFVLLGLTGLTVAVASVDLGRLNVLVALAIAGAKALLVLLYFMHLREARGLVWLFAGSGFLFLAVLILLTMSDVATRTWLS